MNYISALTDYLVHRRIEIKAFQEELEIKGYTKVIHSIFFDEYYNLCVGIDDCGYLFTEDITEYYAEMIIDHLWETEEIFIPVDD